MRQRQDDIHHPEHGYLLRDRPRIVSLQHMYGTGEYVATIRPAALGQTVTCGEVITPGTNEYRDMVLVRRKGPQRLNLSGWWMDCEIWDAIENTDENQWKIRRAVANAQRRSLVACNE